jgi:CBS domain-containing protein
LAEEAPIPIHPKTLREMKVEDIMNRRPRTVGPHTSIDGLLERLLTQLEDCFPVVGKDRKLLGIVTGSDVLHVLLARVPHVSIGHISIREIRKRHARVVEDIMTRRPISARPQMSVVEALNLMASHKLRHLPVVKNGRLVGLICLRDIIDLYRMLR